MAPPAGRPAQPHQARGLRRDAVRRHQLLLLADRADEAERMHPEADHPHDCHHEQGGQRAQRHPDPLARARRAEHQERQRETRRQLHAHAGRQRSRCRACMGAGAGCDSRAQHQRGAERQHQQRVVVRATHSEHQQHRVQPHERCRPHRRLAEAPGSTRDQRNRAEAGDNGDRLEGPQAARESQRRDRVARQREQRSVGGVLKRPSDEPEDRVGGRFRGHVGIRVQSVERPQPRERQVAEHVLGDQRWAEQQDRVGEHDRADERAHRNSAHRRQHQQVAGAHDERQRLKARAGDADAKAAQGTRHPCRPAAAAAGHIQRGPRCGTGADHEDARHDRQQPERAEPSRHATGPANASLRARARGPCAGDRSSGYGVRGPYGAHCYVSPRCECPELPVTSEA